MALALLLLNGSLIASLYALGRVAGAGGIAPLGLLGWQAASSALVVALIAASKGERPPLTAGHLRYYAVAGLLGMTIPSFASYWALAHLPAGIIGLLGSLSPVFTYALARHLGVEERSCVRMVGIGIALLGIVAMLPKDAMPEGATGWLLVAAAAPLSLAGGNVYRTRAWPRGLTPLAAASGMLLTQAALLLPLGAALGATVAPRLPADRLDALLLALTAIASATYVGSFALQRVAGPVVVSQQGYVITAGSLLIGIAVLGERHSPWVWLAVALVFTGVFLVTRRPALPLCKPWGKP